MICGVKTTMPANPKAIWQVEEDTGESEDVKILPLLLLNHMPPTTPLPPCPSPNLWTGPGRAVGMGKMGAQGQDSEEVKRRFLQPKTMNYITSPSPAVWPGRIFALSEPQLLHVQNSDNKAAYFPMLLGGSRVIMWVKCLLAQAWNDTGSHVSSLLNARLAQSPLHVFKSLLTMTP